MSATVVNEVRRGFYLDSVALMRLSAELSARPGVDEAVLMIGTPSNHGIMSDAGLLTDDGRGAGPNDLVIALRAESADAARAALEAARQALDSGVRAAGSEDAPQPRSLAGALEVLPDADLALISTPGEFAAREARAALERGLNVMMFSDNVSLDEEKALKDLAAAKGLLVMGPDCGTAYVAGVPLAFANRVPRGDVGVIAASGTGLQEFAVLLARLGGGIAHGIGVGGRDMSDAVGGRSTLAAIDLLAADPSTRHVVLIGKPPGERTAHAVFERLAACRKPATACVLGLPEGRRPGGIAFAATLKAAAEGVAGRALAADGFDAGALRERVAAARAGERGLIRGLYSGGTLCMEAQLVLQAAGHAVASNAPAGTSVALGGAGADVHTVLDLGADEYTVGRPHPMIEPSVRTPLLREALADARCGAVLLDVMLGLGAHADPAGAVAAALADAPAERPVVIASVCGTDDDPQDRARQVRTLEQAGVIVAPSNADAAGLL